MGQSFKAARLLRGCGFNKYPDNPALSNAPKEWNVKKRPIRRWTRKIPLTFRCSKDNHLLVSGWGLCVLKFKGTITI